VGCIIRDGDTKGLLLRLRTAMNFDIAISDAPFEGLLVGGEEDVEAISLDGAASVEDFYGPVVVVASDNHFGTEGIFSIGGHERVTGSYIVAGSCLAV